MAKFTDLLIQAFLPEEVEHIDLLLGEVDLLRQSCEALSLEDLQAGLARLAPQRLRFSSSLERGQVASWQRANEYIATKINADQSPTFQDVLTLNGILREKESGSVRTQPVYIGHQEACPVHELSDSLAYFEKEILNSDKETVRKAAEVQFWLVSLHPFEDGNGRTSVLVADWLLGLGGYPPLSFESKLDGMIAVFQEARVSATPGRALIKFLKNVQRSYQLITPRK